MIRIILIQILYATRLEEVAGIFHSTISLCLILITIQKFFRLVLFYFSYLLHLTLITHFYQTQVAQFLYLAFHLVIFTFKGIKSIPPPLFRADSFWPLFVN